MSPKHQNGRKAYVMPGPLTVYAVTNLKIFTEFLMQQRNPPATRKSCVLAAPYFASTCIFVLQVDFAQSWAASCSHPPGCRVMLIDDGLEKVVQSNTYLHFNPEEQNWQGRTSNFKTPIQASERWKSIETFKYLTKLSQNSAQKKQKHEYRVIPKAY